MALTKISTAMWNSVPHHLSHDFNVDDVLFVDVSENKVGIGTTSPTAKLEINPSSGDADLILSSNGTQTLRLDQNSIRTTTTNDLALFTNGNTNQLVLDSGGNIGIGTNTPSYKLDVSGTIHSSVSSGYNFLADKTSGGGIGISGSTGTTNYITLQGSNSTNPDFEIYTGGSRRAIITSGGDVGIDTGNLTLSTQSKYLKFYHPSQTDANDGKIGAGVFDTGLNIVGSQTSAGTGRIVRMWGNVISDVSFQAPIFYDSNNTSYYVNPAGSSNMSSIALAGSSYSSGIDSVTDAALVIDRGLKIYNDDGNYLRSILQFDTSAQINVGQGGTALISSVNLLPGNAGYVYAANQMRAPIFYDSNDTNYYLNANGTSRINTIDYTQIKSPSSSNNGRFVNHSSWGTLHQTDSGYIQFGPANSSWAHIYTDRPAFYFNKNLYINNVQVQVVDSTDIRYRGIISNQDWNTYIDGTEAGWYRVNAATGSNRPSAYTYGTELNFSISGANKFQMYAPHNATDGNGIWARTGWSNDYDAWREFAMFGQAPYSGSDLRAPIFYDSNDTAYYLNPNNYSQLNHGNFNQAPSGRTLSLGSDDTSRVFNDTARSSLVINATYYPHLYINATTANNDNHGAVISMTGILTAGGYRRWGMGIANRNPNALSWGYYDNQTNPHYGVGGDIGYTTTGSKMWLNTSGDLATVGSMRAPIFYDYNNTGYYVDPSSTSNLNAVTAVSLTETSALRFKENIQENVDSSIIDKLRPVSYDWEETGDKDYGFIAEEVDELDTTLTTKQSDGELIGIKYTRLIPFLVKKIQEQEERIKQLENGNS